MLQDIDLILGDNPFFGINHMQGSQLREDFEERARRAADTISTAAENSFKAFMITSGGEADELLKYISKHDSRTKKLSLALVLPNPHFVNTLIAELGFVGAIWALVRFDKNFLGDLVVILKGVSGVRRFILLRYLRAEMRRYRNFGFQISHLCLHNIVVDLLLGLGRSDVLGDFIYSCKRLGVEPVLITQNSARLIAVKELSDYTACFSYNVAGYMVNPSLPEVREVVSEKISKCGGIKLWAMQIFASGAVNMDDVLMDPSLKSFNGVVYATTKPSRVIDFRAKLQGGA